MDINLNFKISSSDFKIFSCQIKKFSGLSLLLVIISAY